MGVLGRVVAIRSVNLGKSYRLNPFPLEHDGTVSFSNNFMGCCRTIRLQV